MATTTPITFDDLMTEALSRVRTDTTATAAQNSMKALLNQGLHDLHIQQNWPWSERRATLITHATYTAGSASIQAATRTALEGSGSEWNTAVTGLGFNNMRIGGKVSFGDLEVYTVSAISSDTAATLDSRYIGNVTTASTYALAYGAYTYFEDEYALASDFFRLVDARIFSDAFPVPVVSKQEFYRRYPRNSTPRDNPIACTIIDLGPSGSTADRPRVLFHPPPNAVLQIPYRYITRNLAVSSAGVGAENMSAAADEPIIPRRYRHVLVQYAVAQWYRDKKDDERSPAASAEYADLVKRMANDTEPQRDRPRLATMRSIYRAGVAGPRRTGYHVTGTAFDEMRE